MRFSGKFIFPTSFGRGCFQVNLFSFEKRKWLQKILFDVKCFAVRHNNVTFFLTLWAKWTENAVIGPYTLFSSWFSPLGAKNLLTVLAVVLGYLYLCLIFLLIVLLEWTSQCFMKLWPCILKWWHAGIAFGLLTSSLWLFSLKFKGVLDFPRYWILHNVHSIK